jgi:hypothetical protein
MPTLIDAAVWIYFIVYTILGVLSFWIIDDEKKRNACLQWLQRGFIAIIALWIIVIIVFGAIAAAISGIL